MILLELLPGSRHGCADTTVITDSVNYYLLLYLLSVVVV